MGTSLKGKNVLPEEVNFFLKEQLLMVWKITFTTLGDLPGMLLFLLCTCCNLNASRRIVNKVVHKTVVN